MNDTVGFLIGYSDQPKEELALCTEHTARAVLIVCLAVITAVLGFSAGRVTAPAPTTCFEDQIVVWSSKHHDHSVCVDADDR